MTYKEHIKMIDWLNERFRRSGMKPWYLWATDITWLKVRNWAKKLGYFDRKSTNV